MMPATWRFAPGCLISSAVPDDWVKTKARARWVDGEEFFAWEGVVTR